MKYFNAKFYLLALLCLMSIISCADQTGFEENENQIEKLNKLDKFSRLRGTQIKVLTYNTFLLRDIAVASTTQWSQNARAEKLGNAAFINNYDILLLQECFDNAAATTLRQNSYPNFHIRHLFWARQSKDGIIPMVTGERLPQEDLRMVV